MPLYRLVRNTGEIEKLWNEVMEAEATGRSKYPGMSYEEGVRAAIDWLTDEGQPNPMEDE